MRIGETMGVTVIPLWELPLPAEEPSKTPLLDDVEGGATDRGAFSATEPPPGQSQPDEID